MAGFENRIAEYKRSISQNGSAKKPPFADQKTIIDDTP